MEPKNVDRSGFSCTGDTCDSDSAGVSGIGEAFFDDFLSDCLMSFGGAFDERNRLAKDGPVAFEDSIYIVGRGERAPCYTTSVWVDRGLVSYASIDLKAFVLFIVFGVLHGRFFMVIIRG